MSKKGGVKPKRIGKTFENKVVNIFRSKWNLKKTECRRAISSGTYQVDFSDVLFTLENRPNPHIIVECKIRNNVSLNSFLSMSFVDDKWFDNQIKASIAKYKNIYGIEPFPMLVFSTSQYRLKSPLVIFKKDFLFDIIKNEKRKIKYFQERNLICNLKLSESIPKVDFMLLNKKYVAFELDEILNIMTVNYL